MKYMGSKNRIAKHILPIMLKEMQDKDYTTWIEPFVGGANMIDKVPSSYNRIGCDLNEYLIEMFIMLQNNGVPTTRITKDQYIFARSNKDLNKGMTGYIGFNMSYSGKWFGGFADIVETKDGLRDYQQEAIENVTKQIMQLQSVKFVNCTYQDIDITDSLIYCDPPYQGTTGYQTGSFDHEEFFNWCRVMKSKGNSVFVSEYNAPDDFELVWSKEINSSLSANGKVGGNKISFEKLFKV